MGRIKKSNNHKSWGFPKTDEHIISVNPRVLLCYSIKINNWNVRWYLHNILYVPQYILWPHDKTVFSWPESAPTGMKLTPQEGILDKRDQSLIYSVTSPPRTVKWRNFRIELSTCPSLRPALWDQKYRTSGDIILPKMVLPQTLQSTAVSYYKCVLGDFKRSTAF